MKGADFTLREFQGIPYYSCLAFEDLPHLRHGYSTRRGGTPGPDESSLNLGEMPWDSPARVQENRNRFLSALRLPDAPLITLSQVHSNRVHIIEDISTQWNRPEGDAIITRAENIALGIKTADCLPVLIADPAMKAIAAVHSGWRGTLARILPCTIREMQRAFGSEPSQLVAAIGPGIRACCYEVGRDVADLFTKEYPEYCLASPVKRQGDKYLLDLGKVLDTQMNLAGIRPENRFDLGACTCCNTGEFFSYRAEGPAAGRMMSVIGISPQKGEREKGIKG
jgi:polyphenol oxidase